ncbi:MAG: GntR family transcriptional regulator [Solirubrobacteraceae bacterium]
MARGDHRDARPSEAPVRTPAGSRSQTGGAEAKFDLDDLKIDRDGEIPIGVQLAWALRARIGDGRLAPGQRLPGLRELAEMLGINANTARAVYQRLEQEGLIDSRQGTGTFVARIAQEPSAVGQIAADAAQEARRTGVDPREVAAALYVTAGPPTEAGASPEGHTAGITGRRAAERRKELRAQIAALEQTLSEIQARHPGLIPTPSKPQRHAGPRLLSVEDLEGVRGELVRRLAAAEPLLKDPQGDERTAATRARKVTRGADVQEENDSRGAERQSRPAAANKATRPRPRTRPSTA